MKKLDIPFFKSRGFECGQACVAMMIKYFRPEFMPDLDEFNRVIKHKQGKYTFPPQLAVLLDNFGVKSHVFSSDDIKKFDEDFDQFKRWYGKDFDNEMQYVDKESFDFMVDEMRKKELFVMKQTKFDELLDYFEKGQVIGMPIDWNTLSHKDGQYTGHFVIISGLDRRKGEVLIHDPDIGPFIKYKIVDLKRAWEHPAIADDYLIAFSKE